MVKMWHLQRNVNISSKLMRQTVIQYQILDYKLRFFPRETRPRLAGCSCDHWEALQTTASVDVPTGFSPQSPTRAGRLASVLLAVGCHLFAAPFLLTWFATWQNNLAGKLVEFRKIKVLQWDMGRPSEGDVLARGEKREESLGADQASSCITLKNQLKEWREKVKAGTSLASKSNLSTSDVFFFFPYLKGSNTSLHLERKEIYRSSLNSWRSQNTLTL